MQNGAVTFYIAEFADVTWLREEVFGFFCCYFLEESFWHVLALLGRVDFFCYLQKYEQHGRAYDFADTSEQWVRFVLYWEELADCDFAW